ncbi:MAG TPA: methyltransferase domain-containing protein [Ktedonobacteraceae bacterium]|nr:methyltransferase domain-containing protein [Ktedonobacteraceae bacterium]
MTEQFYRNLAALKDTSKESNVALAETSATDLNGWIIRQLGVRPGESLLDIGSGTGKRTLSLARVTGETGYVLAIDRSFENLSMLSQQSLDAGLEKRIRLLQINLDEFEGYLREEDFDRALASRALYHLKRPRAAFNAIHLALKPGGILLFYGPGRQDHAELKRFHAELCGETSSVENREPTFIEGTGLQCVRDFFAHVEIVRFEQPLRFETPDALHTCWRISRLYDEALEQRFQQAAARHFAFHSVFETIQRVVGIRAVK